ncbi:hypothetical protein JKP88DRAFT_354042 [Tribonema minus]|uniref:Sulfotransferase domain-containing protein n=1 Tax=Tribonema minus TaxID=303371 RepID=A0A836CHX0_9STRA|nr:hypothetical protein JKP88DRAFT_354042 [Tribonema minus]
MVLGPKALDGSNAERAAEKEKARSFRNVSASTAFDAWADYQSAAVLAMCIALFAALCSSLLLSTVMTRRKQERQGGFGFNRPWVSRRRRLPHQFCICGSGAPQMLVIRQLRADLKVADEEYTDSELSADLTAVMQQLHGEQDRHVDSICVYEDTPDQMLIAEVGDPKALLAMHAARSTAAVHGVRRQLSAECGANACTATIYMGTTGAHAACWTLQDMGSAGAQELGAARSELAALRALIPAADDPCAIEKLRALHQTLKLNQAGDNDVTAEQLSSAEDTSNEETTSEVNEAATPVTANIEETAAAAAASVAPQSLHDKGLLAAAMGMLAMATRGSGSYRCDAPLSPAALLEACGAVAAQLESTKEALAKERESLRALRSAVRRAQQMADAQRVAGGTGTIEGRVALLFKSGLDVTLVLRGSGRPCSAEHRCAAAAADADAVAPHSARRAAHPRVLSLPPPPPLRTSSADAPARAASPGSADGGCQACGGGGGGGGGGGDCYCGSPGHARGRRRQRRYRARARDEEGRGSSSRSRSTSAHPPSSPGGCCEGDAPRAMGGEGTASGGDFETRDSDAFICTYVKSGTTWTQQIVNLLMHEGRDPPKSYTEAVPWLEAVAAGGILGAFMLGALTESSYTEAVPWLEAAAAADSSYTEAVPWLEAAAAGGVLGAREALTDSLIDRLSYSFYECLDVCSVVSYTEAVPWLEAAVAGGSYTEAVPWLEAAAAGGVLGAREATGWTLEAINAAPSPRFFKTHAVVADLPRGRAKGLKDVLVSLYHHARNKPDFNFNGDMGDMLAHFTAGTCENGDWFKHVLEWWAEAKKVRVNLENGNWFKHVLEWWAEAQKDPEHVLCLKYEDLIAEPLRGVRSIAQFLGLPHADSVLQAVVDKSSIDAMRKDSKAAAAVGFDHLRRGGAGGWREALTARQSDAFDALYRARMAGSGLAFDFGEGLVIKGPLLVSGGGSAQQRRRQRSAASGSGLAFAFGGGLVMSATPAARGDGGSGGAPQRRQRQCSAATRLNALYRARMAGSGLTFNFGGGLVKRAVAVLSSNDGNAQQQRWWTLAGASSCERRQRRAAMAAAAVRSSGGGSDQRQQQQQQRQHSAAAAAVQQQQQQQQRRRQRSAAMAVLSSSGNSAQRWWQRSTAVTVLSGSGSAQ